MVSEKMKNQITYIENMLHIQYTGGNNFYIMRDFIEQNINEANELSEMLDEYDND